MLLGCVNLHQNFKGGDVIDADVTDTPSRHRGGVAFFHRPAPHFAVEAVQQFGPNVVGFQLVTGARRWYIV